MAKAVHSVPSGCVGKKLQIDSDIAQPAMSRRLETGPRNITSDRNISLLRDLPKREGRRPTTLRTALHLQSNDQGPLSYLERLLEEISSWPGVDFLPSLVAPIQSRAMWIEESLASLDSSAFIYGYEFAHVLIGSTATIHLCLPLVCAHWAIVRGWAEPHYLNYTGLISPGVVLVYTPRDEAEYEICRTLFSTSYRSAVRPVGSKKFE